jgi:hypothetical protein
MTNYDDTRQQYRPTKIDWLLIAESPPPADANKPSSRNFYRIEFAPFADRIFTGAMRALYPDAAKLTDAELGAQKEQWLRRFQGDNWYMIEALEDSQEHKVTKKERQEKLTAAVPRLVERVRVLDAPDAKLILVKSNVFEVCAEPLRAAGFNVLNTANVDYPGHFNAKAFQDKLGALVRANGWDGGSA